MRIIYVRGNEEYGASNFENQKYDLEELWEYHVNGNFDKLIDVEDKSKVEMKFLEFGQVDAKFVKFVRNEIQDACSSETDNFYIV